MKTFLRSVFSAVLVTAFLLLPVAVFATDIDAAYTTLIPQTSDTELVFTHKAEASQARLANGNSYNNITTKTTTVVKSGAGILDRITVNTAGTSYVLTVYDNTAGSGTTIATCSANAQGTLPYNIRFATGLTIVSSGTTAGDVTVSYR